MKLEQQVSNLELSKRLKEIGVKQESYFTHVWVMRSTDDTHDVYEIRMGHKPTLMSTEYSAFTVAELGGLLPKERYWTDCKMNTGRWRCAEYSEDGLAEEGKTSFAADTEADARAKILIYLLENKLIELKI